MSLSSCQGIIFNFFSDTLLLLCLVLQFRERVICEATKEFSSENKLGAGGFGEVYKGYLNGTFVAVKRLSIVF